MTRKCHVRFVGKGKETDARKGAPRLPFTRPLRERYVRETPASAVIFEFLERHRSTLVNGIESKLIPRTNNEVELIIRRFDQHYQNFCGFDTIESAQLFLGVFEKIYRFTPFSQDAQPGIRGKCPLRVGRL